MRRLNLSNTAKVLYLKDIPVYDIEKDILLDKQRAPGILQKHASPDLFKMWLKLRYSSNTNTLARVLKGVTFGQGNRALINEKTRIFSLSDCYWIADKYDNTITFENMSPYFNDFWKGVNEYAGEAVPTLYANGALHKCWLSSTDLYKCGDNVEIEIECSRLAILCQIPCAEVIKYDKGIIIKNFTSKDIMLESIDISGRLDPDDFDETNILELFGFDGFRMILIDAIFGNGDRHAGNFGYLRDANTGEYLSMAPLYDFDHALDATGLKDYLLLDAIDISKSNKQYKEEAIRISTIIASNTSNEVFRKRASCILNHLHIK